jgi:hypothetical protein
MTVYAVSDRGFRVVTHEIPLLPGEERVTTLPAGLLAKIEADQARIRRAALLRSTDWTQGQDCQLSPEAKFAWAEYRQNLRDLPARTDFPNCPWPVAPALATSTT